MKLFIKLFSFLILMLLSGYACTLPVQQNSPSANPLNANGQNAHFETSQPTADQKNPGPEKKTQLFLIRQLKFLSGLYRVLAAGRY